jgi:hypothetical protein
VSAWSEIYWQDVDHDPRAEFVDIPRR